MWVGVKSGPDYQGWVPGELMSQLSSYRVAVSCKDRDREGWVPGADASALKLGFHANYLCLLPACLHGLAWVYISDFVSRSGGVLFYSKTDHFFYSRAPKPLGYS